MQQARIQFDEENIRVALSSMRTANSAAYWRSLALFALRF
jgi:hypothetical protein